MSHRVALLLAAGCAAAGCTLLDTRDRLQLEIVGPTAVSQALRLRVTGTATHRSAILLVDGERFGEVALGDLATVSVVGLANGTHTLEAAVFDGPYPARSQRAGFAVYRDPRVTLTPTPGVTLQEGPFTVTVRLPWPASEATWDAGRARLFDSADPASAPAAVALAPDRRSLVLTASRPLARYPRGLGLTLDLQDEAGNPMKAGDYGPVGWWAPPLDFVLDTPAADAAASRTITVAGAPTGPSHPATVNVFLGALVATLSAPGWSATLDVSSVPEGAYRLAVGGGGYIENPGPVVTVDHTPPTISCFSDTYPGGDLADGFPVRVVPSEPLRSEGLLVRIGGTVVSERGAPVELPGPMAVSWFRLGHPLPATLEIALPGAIDLAGNPLASSCALDLPVWSQVLGTPIPSASGGALAAAQAWFSSEYLMRGAWVEGGDLQQAWWASDGVIRLEQVSGGGTVVALSAQRPGWEEAAFAWLELESDGHVRVHAQHFTGQRPQATVTGPLNATAGSDARDPAVSPDGRTLAWSEDLASGGRAIFLTDMPIGGAFFPAYGPLSDPGVPSDHPSPFNSTVAYLAHPQGGVDEVHVLAVDGGGWVDTGGALNAVPTDPAGPPAMLAHDQVAWVEGGVLWSRQLDPASGWSAPVRVAGDAAAPVRSPAAAHSNLFDPGVVYVERRGGSDVLRFARLLATGWTVDPAPVSGPFRGEVTGLGVASPPGLSDLHLTVTWTDASGQVHAALLNE